MVRRLRAEPGKVGFVGAGNMGGALVERLCEAGWPVAVCDIDPPRQQQALAAGASLADTPLSAVAQLGPHDALVIVVVVGCWSSSTIVPVPVSVVRGFSS